MISTAISKTQQNVRKSEMSSAKNMVISPSLKDRVKVCALRWGGGDGVTLWSKPWT